MIHETKEVNGVFHFVLDTFERKCDLSIASMVSPCRQRDLVDARKAFYKILRDIFGMSYTSIGLLFKKNHSTIICAMNEHDRLYKRDKNYTDFYDMVYEDVRLRIKLKNIYNMRNGVVKLKVLYVNEKAAFNVLIKCFPSKKDSFDYMNENKVAIDSVVFHGQPISIGAALAKETVNSDEKRYMLDLMKRSKDPIMSIVNEPIDRYYMDYRACEFIIKNDPQASLMSAIHIFDDQDVALIHLAAAPLEQERR